jgi:hypothetical protein
MPPYMQDIGKIANGNHLQPECNCLILRQYRVLLSRFGGGMFSPMQIGIQLEPADLDSANQDPNLANSCTREAEYHLLLFKQQVREILDDK